MITYIFIPSVQFHNPILFMVTKTMSPLKSTSILVLCFAFVSVTDSARILGVTYVPSISHQVAFQPIWKELSLRGHKVTVIAPNVLNDSRLTNLTEIDVGFTYKVMQGLNLQTNIAKGNYLMTNFFVAYNAGSAFIKSQLESEQVKNLIQSEEEFDLVLVEARHPLVFAFGARFKAPIIAISSVEVNLHVYDIFGNPTHPVLSPDVQVHFQGEPTFADRLSSLLFNIVSRTCYYWWLLPQYDKLAKKHFGKDLPYLGDIVQNTSLMLKNTNLIMHTPRPNVPSIVEIGQLHIREKKPLPKDIREYLDSSTQGVVYLSFGSNIKSVNLSNERRNTIIMALAELPFNVIWKWEGEDLPGKPDNVFIRKWLPQQDILSHPNVKVFITQGGLQSIEEAVVNGVPMVGIPFFFDQPNNIKVLVGKGMAIGLDHEIMTKDELKHAIIEVATNSRFREQLQKAKNLLLDQPMTGLNKAIWWIEYVLRHEDMRHLRSHAADMSFFQYFMVDVLGFLLISLLVLFYLLIGLLRLMVNISRRKSKTD